MNKIFSLSFFILFLASCQKGNDHPTTPVSNGNLGTLYAHGINRGVTGLAAIDLEKDTVAWLARAHLGDNNAMLYENGIIYTSSLYGPTAVDAITGKLLWSTNLITPFYSQSNTRSWSRPVIKDSLLYQIALYEDDAAGLYCINKNT